LENTGGCWDGSGLKDWWFLTITVLRLTGQILGPVVPIVDNFGSQWLLPPMIMK
jgi:hypothetical protein